MEMDTIRQLFDILLVYAVIAVILRMLISPSIVRQAPTP
jgi:hypothetical protein